MESEAVENRRRVEIQATKRHALIPSLIVIPAYQLREPEVGKIHSI